MKAQHYDKNKVEIKNGQAEKLKLVKSGILITEEQADILNEGVLHGGNTIAEMYYPAENPPAAKAKAPKTAKPE